MDNIQETLLFPVRDAEARNQFLIACAVMLAGFIIPLLPIFLLMGYTAKIMRQVIEENKTPSMPAWQASDWSEMFTEGLRLWGAQMILTLPLLLLLGCGFVFVIGGSIGFATLTDTQADAIAPISVTLYILGFLMIGIFSILSLPYGVIVSAALPHVAIKRSFQAAFEFKEWFAIFRKALGQFILGYAVIMVASFVFIMIMKVAMITLVLICILPLLMIPYAAYQMLIMNTVYAQAYAIGRKGL
jgi:hypothetical protein